MLAADGVDAPVTQSSLNYILLSSYFFCSFGQLRREGLTVPLWLYLFWAICDVEANFLVVLAYQYTSIRSVMLLDCFTIPCVMCLSRCFLAARYTTWHVVACLICLVGLVLTVLSDVDSAKGNPSHKGSPWFGDVLVLVGASLYGISNVLQEWLVKGGGFKRKEALGMLGLFGMAISLAQALILERHAVVRLTWSLPMMLSLLGFQLCLFGVYVLTSRFLSFSDAALFNLSLLTSDLYSVLFSWRVQHMALTWLFCVAFGTTISGLVLYHTQPVAIQGQYVSTGDATARWIGPV